MQRTYYTVVLLFSFHCSNCGQEPKRGLRHGSGLKTVVGRAAAAGVAVLFFPFLGFFPLDKIGGRRRGQLSAPLSHPSPLAFLETCLPCAPPSFRTHWPPLHPAVTFLGLGAPVTGGCQGLTHRLLASPDQWQMPWKRRGVVGWRGLADLHCCCCCCCPVPTSKRVSGREAFFGKFYAQYVLCLLVFVSAEML